MRLGPLLTGLLVLTLMGGFLLRSCGLSHDLDIGRTYHPDAPKQIDAAEQFLKGLYYISRGHPDYDGYPLFNSHLVATVYRAVDGGRSLKDRLVGRHVPSDPPLNTELFWITLWLNVTLSTAVIFLVFRMGLILYGPAEALLGAVLIALSPIDVVGAHYATNDSTAGFFAALTALFACRIYRRGRALDYVGGACAAVFAFATKYHGAMAVTACAAAHVLHWGWRGSFRLRSLGLVLLAAVAAAGALAVAMPGLRVNASGLIEDIRVFLIYSGSFGVTPEEANMAMPVRWFVGLQYVFPTFLAVLGPILLSLLLIGPPLEIWRDRRLLVLAVTPLCYVFLGLALKPKAFPAHHLIVTPVLFLMAARLLCQAGRLPWRRPLPRLAAFCLGAGTIVPLAVHDYEEDFYFRRNDMRVLFDRWVEDAVPSTFHVWCTNYPIGSFLGLDFEYAANWQKDDNLMVFYPGIPNPPPLPYALRQKFWLRDDSVVAIRNTPIETGLSSPRLIRRGWKLPVFQRAPAGDDVDVVLDGEKSFLRTGKMLVVEEKQRERYLFAERRVQNALAVLRCGSKPTAVKLDFGGEVTERVLAAGETLAVPVRSPRSCLPPKPGRFVYRVKLASSWGPVALFIATTPQEQGTALFNCGRYREALPHLKEALRESDNPTLRVMAALAAREVEPGNTSPPEDAAVREFAEGEWTPQRLWATYRITEQYLAQLPFVESSDACMWHRDAAVVSPEMILEPGAYRIGLQLSANIVGEPTGTVRVAIADARTARVLTSVEFHPGATATNETAALNFVVPPDCMSCHCAVTWDGYEQPHIARLAVAPVPLDTLRWYQAWLRDPASRGGRAAAQAPPPSSPAGCVFREGLTLRSYRLETNTAPRSGSVALNLYWDVARPTPFLGMMAVYVHALDRNGKIAFQADRDLLDDLHLTAADGLVTHARWRVSVPGKIAPGEYALRVGLYVPSQVRALGLKRSDLPTSGDGVLLGRLTVTE